MKKKNTEFVKPGGLDLKDRLVSIQRVTKVTKGGRAFGFSAIVVVGDENGVVGHGLGKAKEVSIAISKAVEDAKKNLVRIPYTIQQFLMNKKVNMVELVYIFNLLLKVQVSLQVVPLELYWSQLVFKMYCQNHKDHQTLIM